MKKRHLVPLAPIVALALIIFRPGAVALGWAEERSSAPNALERYSWTGTVDSGGAVCIDNPFGDVRLRPGGERGEIEVAAVTQQLGTNGARLEVRVEDGEECLHIGVGWASAPGGEGAPVVGGNPSRTDLAVLVPPVVRVSVIADGMIEAVGVRADLDLESGGGEIRVRGIGGAVRAAAGDGGISAALVRGSTSLPQSFRTTTGPIEVWVEPEADLEGVIATSASITSDFTMIVEHRDREEPNKRATITIGDGGSRIDLSSLRGPVSLRRLAPNH